MQGGGRDALLVVLLSRCGHAPPPHCRWHGEGGPQRWTRSRVRQCSTTTSQQHPSPVRALPTVAGPWMLSFDHGSVQDFDQRAGGARAAAAKGRCGEGGTVSGWLLRWRQKATSSLARSLDRLDSGRPYAEPKAGEGRTRCFRLPGKGPRAMHRPTALLAARRI